MSEKLTYVSLFSGVGGGDLAAQHMFGWNPLAYVEWDEFCKEVLSVRQQDGWFKRAPIFGDIRSFVSDGFAAELQGMVDVVLGGFPCQPFSNAGNQLGVDDPRNMWPATRDVLSHIRPRHCVLENVSALISNGYFGTVIGDLAALGFDVEWGCFRAETAGAPHRRERVFILGTAPHAEHERHVFGHRIQNRQSVHVLTRDSCEARGLAHPDGKFVWSDGGEAVTGDESPHGELGSATDPAGPDVDVSGTSTRKGREGSATDDSARTVGAGGSTSGEGGPALDPLVGWWEFDPADWAPESGVGRVAHGVANRDNRLKACGNGIVPHQLAMAVRYLSERSQE